MIDVIIGAVTGIVGPIVGGIFKYKHAKLQKEMLQMNHKHDVEMVREETKAMIEEAKANIKITQAQVEGAVELKEIEGYIKSQEKGNEALFGNKWVDALLKVEGSLFSWTRKDGTKAEFISWKIFTVPIATLVAFLFGLVDFIRGLIRPALTVYLCGATTWVTLLAWKIMETHGLGLTSDQAVAIFQQVTSIVTYLTVSSVTWWFGDRMMSK